MMRQKVLKNIHNAKRINRQVIKDLNNNIVTLHTAKLSLLERVQNKLSDNIDKVGLSLQDKNQGLINRLKKFYDKLLRECKG